MRVQRKLISNRGTYLMIKGKRDKEREKERERGRERERGEE